MADNTPRPTDYRTELVLMADRIAGSSVSSMNPQPGDQARYLDAFRVAHRHLSQTVDGDPAMGTESATKKAADEFWPK